MAPPFARAAQRLGIRVIGPDSPSGGFLRLARSLKARGVDGVFLASQTVDRRLLSALRAGLGQSATLIGADTLLPYIGSPSRIAKRSAGCTYWGGRHRPSPTAGPGQAFAGAFGTTRPSRANDAWAPAAAQATNVLLTAIARSDGTRASVIHQLFRVHVKHGILGNFAFTPRGDISPATVLVYRVIRGPPWTRPVRTITTRPPAGKQTSPSMPESPCVFRTPAVGGECDAPWVAAEGRQLEGPAARRLPLTHAAASPATGVSLPGDTARTTSQIRFGVSDSPGRRIVRIDHAALRAALRPVRPDLPIVCPERNGRRRFPRG